MLSVRLLELDAIFGLFDWVDWPRQNGHVYVLPRIIVGSSKSIGVHED